MNVKEQLTILWLDDQREPYNYFSAMEKASEATESADLAAAAATEAKGYRDNASKIVTPDGLSAKVNENTDENNKAFILVNDVR